MEGYQYDAYGKTTVITDGDDGDSIVNFTSNDVRTSSGWSSFANPYQYTGQRYDPETGLMYYKNRYYDADLGRFICRGGIILAMILEKFRPYAPAGAEWLEGLKTQLARKTAHDQRGH